MDIFYFLSQIDRGPVGSVNGSPHRLEMLLGGSIAIHGGLSRPVRRLPGIVYLLPR